MPPQLRRFFARYSATAWLIRREQILWELHRYFACLFQIKSCWKKSRFSYRSFSLHRQYWKQVDDNEQCPLACPVWIHRCWQCSFSAAVIAFVWRTCVHFDRSLCRHTSAWISIGCMRDKTSKPMRRWFIMNIWRKTEREFIFKYPLVLLVCGDIFEISISVLFTPVPLFFVRQRKNSLLTLSLRKNNGGEIESTIWFSSTSKRKRIFFEIKRMTYTKRKCEFLSNKRCWYRCFPTNWNEIQRAWVSNRFNGVSMVGKELIFSSQICEEDWKSMEKNCAWFSYDIYEVFPVCVFVRFRDR